MTVKVGIDSPGDGAVMRQTPDAIHAQQTEDVFDAEAGFEVRMFDR